MVEVTILIPITDNDGKAFTPAEVGEFESLLIETFEGFTRLPGWAVGGWVDKQGAEIRDILFGYLVGVSPGVIGQGKELREVVDFAKRHFRQDTIYLRYLGVSEIV